MSEQKELKLRIEAKKKEFQAELESIKNDMTDSAKKNRVTLEKKIEEISHDLKNTGDKFTESVAKKFNEWLN